MISKLLMWPYRFGWKRPYLQWRIWVYATRFTNW